MKFFQSKYYLPASTHAHLETAIHESKITAGKEGDWNLEIVSKYMHYLHYGDDWKLNVDLVIAEWELVEDLTAHYGVMDNIEIDGEDMVGYSKVYFHATLECFVVIREAESGHRKPLLCVPYTTSDHGVFYTLVQQKYFIYQPKEENELPVFGMLIKTMHGYDISYVNVKEMNIDLESHYGTGFEKISDKIIEYTSDENKNGLIILHGIPGTGKTSYLRWLSGKAKRNFVYIPTEIVGQLSSTGFASFLMHNTGLTFIVEDAETVLMAREDGQANSQVASILNMTDGIQGDIFNSQFICTFNTDLDRVDKALLRPGRLLVEHEFKALSVDDSNKLLTKLGKDATVTEPTTLAKLMN